MITEDYVSFETAKLLKEKGFDGECSRFYMPNGHRRWKYEHYHDFDISDRIDCPTLQMAMKWLREVHNIHFLLSPFFTKELNVVYSINILDKEMVGSLYDNLNENTYEEACDAAVKYCLENLI